MTAVPTCGIDAESGLEAVEAEDELSWQKAVPRRILIKLLERLWRGISKEIPPTVRLQYISHASRRFLNAGQSPQGSVNILPLTKNLGYGLLILRQSPIIMTSSSWGYDFWV